MSLIKRILLFVINRCSYDFREVRSARISLRARLKGKGLSIGKGTFINDNCYISMKAQESYISSKCMIGPNTVIIDHNHKVPLNCESMYELRSHSIIKAVIIQEDCWIGANVTILPGVTLGRGSIVAAGSVVTKNVEEFSIYGGNPANVLGRRE